jgi:hypothetical protein
MTASHTPGPWASSPYSSIVGCAITAQGHLIAGVRGEKDVSLANAKLIAAAPSLLTALQALVRLCADDEFEPRSNAGRAALDSAHAAIAKAVQP